MKSLSYFGKYSEGGREDRQILMILKLDILKTCQKHFSCLCHDFPRLVIFNVNKRKKVYTDFEDHHPQFPDHGRHLPSILIFFSIFARTSPDSLINLQYSLVCKYGLYYLVCSYTHQSYKKKL